MKWGGKHQSNCSCPGCREYGGRRIELSVRAMRLLGRKTRIELSVQAMRLLGRKTCFELRLSSVRCVWVK